MEPSQQNADLVVLETARSPFEAQVIAAVLRGAGIPAYVGGTLLADEFAASQRLMNLGGVQVQVPRQQVEAAQLALVEARQAGQALDAAVAEEEQAVETPPRPSPPPPPPRPLLRALIWAAALVAAVWILVHKPGDAPAEAYDVEVTDGGHRYRWRHNGMLAFESVDRDRDGFAEIYHQHNLRGERTQSAYDDDDDGLADRFEGYAPDGSVATVAFDRDGDGRCERWEERRPGGTRVWIDADGDARFERVEDRSAAGELLRAWIHDADAGLVPAR